MSSQLGANLGFGSMMSGLGQQYTGLSGLAAQQSADAQRYGAIASTGMQLAQFGFGSGKVTNPFATTGTPLGNPSMGMY